MIQMFNNKKDKTCSNDLLRYTRFSVNCPWPCSGSSYGSFWTTSTPSPRSLCSWLCLLIMYSCPIRYWKIKMHRQDKFTYYCLTKTTLGDWQHNLETKCKTFTDMLTAEMLVDHHKAHLVAVSFSDEDHVMWMKALEELLHGPCGEIVFLLPFPKSRMTF